ncbi:MAG: PQQ-binding-like beta-propeller repeat protein, partial [Synergistaceae bacterium]|nr:PQQ-binding-like beta-propeller repeat protein [Synergistaceae bacterium]
MKRIKRSFVLSAAIAAVLSLSCGIAGGAENWPMFRGNAARTGAASAAQQQNPIQGNEIWKVTLQQPIQSSPAVSNGVVYFGANDGA